MIHQNSTRPVFVKKIYLKTWRLRDEIEHVIQKKLERGERKKFLDLKNISHLVRQTSLQMKKNKIYDGMCILSEIDMNEIRFFNSFHFVEGQSIMIEFQIPKTFTVSAEVAYSNSYNVKNKIISNQNFAYRIKADFTFLRPEEQTLLRNFVASIKPNLLENQEEVEDMAS